MRQVSRFRIEIVWFTFGTLNVAHNLDARAFFLVRSLLLVLPAVPAKGYDFARWCVPLAAAFYCRDVAGAASRSVASDMLEYVCARLPL